MNINKLLFKTARLYPDEWYVKTIFKHFLGYELDLNNPVTFNEKINWLKLYDHNPLYTMLADKYEVKKYVASLIGNEHVVPNIGVWQTAGEIDFSSLPKQFVLKATHDSGGICICRDKNEFDVEAAKKKLSKSLRTNCYYHEREWVYKDIPPRIIADKFLDDHSGHELQDYKFWCFNGVPRIMYCTNKAGSIYENFYDMDFNPLPISRGFMVMADLEKPSGFSKMKEFATMLSKDIPFVRVDFFEVDEIVYFGEYTFYDWGGLKRFSDFEWDKKLGSYITLPR